MKIFFVFFQLLLAADLMSCEPCTQPSAAEAFKKADLVVIAKQIGAPQNSRQCGTQSQRVRNPEWRNGH